MEINEQRAYISEVRSLLKFTDSLANVDWVLFNKVKDLLKVDSWILNNEEEIVQQKEKDELDQDLVDLNEVLKIASKEILNKLMGQPHSKLTEDQYDTLEYWKNGLYDNWCEMSSSDKLYDSTDEDVLLLEWVQEELKEEEK